MRRFLHALPAALLLGLASATAPAAGFDEMTPWVPEDANVVMAVDTAKAMQTPLAQERYWKALMQLEAQNGRSLLAPKADRQIVAAHFNAIRDGLDWEVLLFSSDAMPRFEALAAKENARIERIAGAPAFPLRGHLLAVRLSDSLLGLRFPAERQAVSRWVKSGDARAALPASPFVKRAVHALDPADSILAIALDLDGLLSPDQVKAGASNLRSLRAKSIDPDKAAPIIASLRTVLLNLTVASALQARLELEFAEDPALLAPVAANLVREAVEAAGLGLEEMKTWDAKVQGRSIVLTGPIAGSGVMRLCSLLTLTKPRDTQAAPSQGSAQDPAAATQQHFKSVVAILDDVKKIRGMDDPSQSAIYLERYASKIESLPILNVDPDLLKWSASVSIDLAECSYQLRDAGLAGRRRLLANTNPLAPSIDANVSNTADGTYHDNSYVAVRNEILYRRKYQARENRKIEQETGLSGREIAAKLLRGIDEETVKVRRAMTAKYKIEF